MAETAKSPANGNLTARDTELLSKAIQCIKGGEISIDYNKFAELGGFKNANSAKAAWHSVKKKLDRTGCGSGASAANYENDEAAPDESPSKTKPNKRSREDDSGDKAGEDEPTEKKSPIKKQRVKKSKVKEEEEEEDVVHE